MEPSGLKNPATITPPAPSSSKDQHSTTTRELLGMFGTNRCSPRMHSGRHSRRLLVRRGEQWGPPLNRRWCSLCNLRIKLLVRRDNPSDDEEEAERKEEVSRSTDRHHPSSHGAPRSNRASSFPIHRMPVYTSRLQFGTFIHSSLSFPGPELWVICSSTQVRLFFSSTSPTADGHHEVQE